MSVMPGLEEMVTDLSWVEFSDEEEPACDALECGDEAVVRTFWETPPKCPHEVRLYCVKHRDLCLEDHAKVIEGVVASYWTCGVCRDTTGVTYKVHFLGMEPIK